MKTSHVIIVPHYTDHKSRAHSEFIGYFKAQGQVCSFVKKSTNLMNSFVGDRVPF